LAQPVAPCGVIAQVTATDGAPGSNGLNRDIVNALTDLMKRAGAISQLIADLFDMGCPRGRDDPRRIPRNHSE
jgi:hypothetical protein